MHAIGIVNVNTSQAMTDVIVRAAREVAAPDTTIVGLTPTIGPDSVETHVEAYVSATGVIDAVHRYQTSRAEPNVGQHDESQLGDQHQPKKVDAWIIAGYGDLGKEALQELTDVPVVDITEAAAVAAMAVGDTFGVVTTLDRTTPMIRSRLKQAGLADRCVSITGTGLGVLELGEDPERTRRLVIEKARQALQPNHSGQRAEAICLGCAGMAGQARQLSAVLEVPVIDGVAAAVGQAESLIRQGLRTSRVGTFAPRQPKSLHGFEHLEVQKNQR